MPHVVLFIGTRRGLFIARSDAVRRHWELSPPRLEGREVFHALLDPRDGRTAWAASDHKVWGPHIHRSSDGGRTWELLESAPHFSDERGLTAVWHLAPGPASQPATLYAGIEPAGLFVSHDAGAGWRSVDGLNEHPTRERWQPAGGALALGSIAIDPREPARILCAISAGGVYRSDDGGATWRPANRGLRADFLPRAFPEAGQCVHRMRMHPERPERLWQQNHCGTYRSDDGGESWVDVTEGLPSDYGYALAIDARDPDTAWVVPETSSHMRTVVDGRLRVYRTRDAGGSWVALKRGLPQEHAYVGVLREAMDADAMEPSGVYVGTSSGHLFASRNGGDSWQVVAGFLPRILSVTAAVVEG
ncbi:MAG TPA: hypothetical protein VMK65_08395 [Longimicrobiales bacterium]|nr:hypothetical protein [Longimicrobiales bacterium]